ncbi:MAG: bacillithiol biosynthesis cysteine-adding enzyme BshC [Chlamydiales bacterium]|jgi:bacillithiol biosynthesis cysteine-adding enzyme BshC
MVTRSNNAEALRPKIVREHLPADIFGLSNVARAGLAQGMDFGPVPVPRRLSDLVPPKDRHDVAERRALARVIGQGLDAVDPPDRVRTSLNVLANPDVFCVVTGQQPGFLAGPLYSLYKAMQAAKLAHELSSQWGRPVVPIFWNHGDDHDIAEVHHAWQLNRNLDIQKIGIAGLSSGRLPVSRIVMDAQLQRLPALRESLTGIFEEHAFTEEALDLLLPRDGETLVRAFTRALTVLLGEHGLVVVEPDWIRASMGSHLAQVVSAGVFDGLEAGSRELHAAGLEPGIAIEEAALVYRVDGDGRRALRAGGEGFRFDEEPGSRTAAELAAEIVADPEGYSPGALLRPLVQDAVFPTCAYIGGHGELAYHAQLGALRDACHLPRVPFVPRVSATLLDEATRSSLQRLELELRQVLQDPSVLDDELEAPQGTPEVVAALRASAERAATEIASHRQELTKLDHGLGSNLGRTANQIRALVEKIASKAERVHANSTGKGKRHTRRLTGMLMPRGLPQERVLGPLQFTARFGKAWVDALYADWPALSSEHLAIQMHAPEGQTDET